ncbi:MAG: hypothetical protein JXR56_08725 [Candidatus Cloacimonetes bacterium]|nr:hypothetical protein [Candidatus Cloacimonadota bacterium]
MNKLLLLLLFVLLMTTVYAVTLEVSLDGTHQFTSIQTAVDASADSDTILVYPGRYLGHIDIVDKEISVISFYHFTGNRDDINNTIVDANFESNCLRVHWLSNIFFQGFTLTNGTGYAWDPEHIFGGAVLISECSTLDLSDCMVVHNKAITAGGVSIANYCTLNLSGCVIKNNSAIYQCGGIATIGGIVNFDPVNLNSIFNNYGQVQDIFLQDTTCGDIVLDTLSVDLTSPDGFFVAQYSDDDPDFVQSTVSNLNSWFNQIDADIFVSPDGDDNNDGLTPETALQRIAYATRIIQPNEANPNTVFILPGVYSPMLNNQFFPVYTQSHTKLLGAGETPDDVMIGDEPGVYCTGTYKSTNTEIGGFTIRNNIGSDSYTLGVGRGSNSYVHDVNFVNNNTEYTGFSSGRFDTVNVQNLTISDINITNQSSTSFFSYECSLTMNNIILNNIVNSYDESLTPGINLTRNIVTANNIIISNCSTNASGILFQYWNESPSSFEGGITLNNFLMYNNTSFSNRMPMAIFISEFGQNSLNNMTIANNITPTAAVRLSGDFDVRNSIIYNPDSAYEIHLWDVFTGDPSPIYSDIDIDYSLVRGGDTLIYGDENQYNTLNWGNHNLNTNPLFRGDVAGDIPEGDIRWVQLTQNSPCVDAGTPDTLGMSLPANDITGNPRIWNNIIDMGAHEYNPTVDNEENSQPAIRDEIILSHFPNPVIINNDNTGNAIIEFTLPKKPIEKPTLEIYNIRGQKVRSIKITQSLSALVRSAGLSTEEKQSGEKYSQIWDCRDDNRKLVTSGIYFYKVSSEGKEAIGKMMVLK